MNSIIVNADDFGLSESCTKAIADAFGKKLISSTSACANGPYIKEAYLIAKEAGFINSIGIHINLHDNRAISKGIANDPFFCSEGYFHRGIDRLQRPTKAQIANLRDEIKAQVEYLLEIGFNLTHADSHHHLHTCIFFEKTIQEVLFQYGIKKIRLHRNVGDIVFYKKIVKKWFNSKLKKQGFTTTKYFGGIGDFLQFQNLMNKGISEIMVHPDYDKDNVLIDRENFDNLIPVGQSLNRIIPLIEGKKLISYGEL